MICTKEGCDKVAITFHGVMKVTHGYCEEHRCCYNCGNYIKNCGCENPIERPEYLEHLEQIKVASK